MKNANLLDDPGKNERSPLRVGLGIAGAVTLAAILLAVFLITHPATASDGDNSEVSDPPAQSEDLPSAPAQSEDLPSAPPPAQSEDLPSALPESQPPAQTAPIITNEDPEGAMALEELLDTEQLEVFNAAVYVYGHLFGGDTDEVNYWDGLGPYPYQRETMEIGDMLYTKSWGPYANYADFDALIHSVFTERCWTEHNEWTEDIQLYTNVDGSLWYIAAAKGSDTDYNWDVPDTCRLVEQTDDVISFTLIGHYSRLYPREDGTYGHTLEFPARMVRTADGWRMDQLYLPHRDRDRLYD